MNLHVVISLIHPKHIEHSAAKATTGIWHWHAPKDAVVKALGCLNVYPLAESFMGIIMHTCIYGTAPNFLLDL